MDADRDIFFPLFEHDDTGATFYIKVHGAPEQAIPSIRRLVHQDDPRLPILWFRTLDDQVNRSLSTERLLAALSSSFGALALLLSLIGLYGVMSFVVTRRTREIGIRLALSATGASAIRLVLRDAVTMIAAGMAIALFCIAPSASSSNPSCSASLPLIPLQSPRLHCSSPLAPSRQHSSRHGELRT